jgi:hypothetical protein
VVRQATEEGAERNRMRGEPHLHEMEEGGRCSEGGCNREPGKEGEGWFV